MSIRGDEGDRAAHYQQMEIDHGLTRRRVEGPAATGECLYCGAPVGKGLRWCDVECRSGYEEEQRILQKQEAGR